MTMTTADFQFYRNLLKDKSGLALADDKTYLLESRLPPVAQKWKLAGLDALTAQLRIGANKDLLADVVDAMTTNETLFFRDDKPFAYMKQTLLPELLARKAGSKSLRIWSSACSSGQEPYSIAMMLHELLGGQKDFRVEILATDISDTALAHARNATYTQFEIQRGLPVSLASRNFIQKGGQWQLNDTIRNMVRFERFNLLDRMDRLGHFDLILCRNVLIYFDDPTKARVLEELSKRVAPGGYLCLGGSETVRGMVRGLDGLPECPGLYRPMAAQVHAVV